MGKRQEGELKDPKDGRTEGGANSCKSQSKNQGKKRINSDKEGARRVKDMQKTKKSLCQEMCAKHN